ncbi:hypothetical protein [Nonomuraea sp. NPDC049400]|uniref:hypothetical protein n=1 Tax=Nonomuraea sp. NPDC049400 TaxID=3364352 RepID=UPI0037AC2489
MEEHLNVHPRAVMERPHFFGCGGQAISEVPRNSDISGCHVALDAFGVAAEDGVCVPDILGVVLAAEQNIAARLIASAAHPTS